MPLYEYRCDDCGHQFEILQRMDEGADGLACPECGRERLGKQFSTFASAVSDGPSAAQMPPSCGDCHGTPT
ncbi:MAG: zinc ribbon domain-containing protein [bacterium]|nr:zinc ribbon domain-containing protein [bacterium]